MTRLQNAYMSMFHLIEISMNKYQLIWQNNSLVVDCMNELHQYREDLMSQAVAQGYGLKGITEDFRSIRLSLIDNGFIIKEALNIYYTMNAMTDEMKLYSFKKSYLVRLRTNDFYVVVADISQKASALAASLISLGVTQQQIDGLANDVNSYYDKIINREKLKEHRKGVTAGIPEIISDCRLYAQTTPGPLHEYVCSYTGSNGENIFCLPQIETHGRSSQLLLGDI